jgi:hypothetical protein
MQLRKLFKRPIVINVSKAYRSLLAIVLSLLLLSQFVLTTPGVRAVLTYIDKFEGIYANSQAARPTLVEITLLLVDAQPSADIEILQNGQPIAIFYEREISITVSDNSVIEIDGRKVKNPFSVKVINIPSDIEAENIEETVVVNSNISLIGRIFIK